MAEEEQEAPVVIENKIIADQFLNAMLLDKADQIKKDFHEHWEFFSTQTLTTGVLPKILTRAYFNETIFLFKNYMRRSSWPQSETTVV